MHFVYNGHVATYFYVSDSTVYKLQQRIICRPTVADVLPAASL